VGLRHGEGGGAPNGRGSGMLDEFTQSAAAPAQAGVGARASRQCADGRLDAVAIGDYRAWRKPAEGDNYTSHREAIEFNVCAFTGRTLAVRRATVRRSC
jgi:hypothetical protein